MIPLCRDATGRESILIYCALGLRLGARLALGLGARLALGLGL